MNRMMILAPSISVGLGVDFGMHNGKGSFPVVSMNFPPDFAKRIIEHLFQLYAKPEHFLFGVSEPRGNVVEVWVYFLAHLPILVSFPKAREVLINPDQFTDGPTIYLIGAEADISWEVVRSFLERQKSWGKYYMVCGYHIGGKKKLTSMAGDWKIELTETHSLKEIHQYIQEALGFS